MVPAYIQHTIYTCEAKAAEAASHIELDEGETVHVSPDAAGTKFIVEVRFNGEHVLYI